MNMVSLKDLCKAENTTSNRHIISVLVLSRLLQDIFNKSMLKNGLRAAVRPTRLSPHIIECRIGCQHCL